MNTLTRMLGIRHPVVQGPFGGGRSSVRLAAAVSNGGGLGSFGAHDFPPDQLARVIAELRTVTSQPFNINLWVSRHDAGAEETSVARFKTAMARFGPIYERLGIAPPSLVSGAPDAFTFAQQAEVILELKPAVFSFVFGIPAPSILSECRRRGIITLGAATTCEEAKALEDAGVDAIVATGSDAGGHRPSFLRRAEESLVGTMALVPQIVDAVRVPIIAAGGIADARGLNAALRLGAQAVQIGTAFLACEESGCSTPHRAALFSPAAAHTRLTRHFTGRLARFIGNPLLEELEGAGNEVLPFPTQSAFVRPIKDHALRINAPDLLPLYAGQAASLVRHRHAAHLMTALVGDLE
jgi:nitronate monooxygenase